MSQLAAFVGMNIATIANVRVSNAARETKSLGSTLKVAFQGGSVMGLSVGGFAFLGLGLVYLIFGKILGQTEIINIQTETNWLGISYIPFAMSSHIRRSFLRFLFYLANLPSQLSQTNIKKEVSVKTSYSELLFK